MLELAPPTEPSRWSIHRRDLYPELATGAIPVEPYVSCESQPVLVALLSGASAVTPPYCGVPVLKATRSLERARLAAPIKFQQLLEHRLARS